MEQSVAAGSIAQYGVTRQLRVMVPMRDGVRLATDVHLPVDRQGNIVHDIPVLLERTPYNREDSDLVATATFFAKHGYAVAIQDVRGRFESEGEWYPFAKEANDGYDTVEWLGAQEWSNGKVGTIGLSYAGSDQHALASLNPPSLKAMYIVEGTSNYLTNAMRHGGAMELRFLPYALLMAWDSPKALANPALQDAVKHQMDNIDVLLQNLPFKKGTTVLRHFPLIEQWVFDVLSKGEYTDYWKQRGYNVAEYYDEHSDVPMMFMSGWYDTYPKAAADNYVEFTKRKQSDVRLLIGPWLHDILPLRDTFSGNADFGMEAPTNYDLDRLRFFDETLKGHSTGLSDEPPIKIFVMGKGTGKKLLYGQIDHGGYWRYENEWPIARTQFKTLYLHGDGSLAEQPVTDKHLESTTYTFDPKNPVPTIGGSISAADYVIPPGGYDQRYRKELESYAPDFQLNIRQDIITFLTEPLTEDTEVTGVITAKLFVSTDAVDTDFTIKIMDVYPPNDDYPDGYALNIQDSLLRLRYRNGFERAEFVTKDEVTEIEIELYPTSNVFAEGHQIRIDISSSNFPRFDVNPNTGEALGKPGKFVVAQNTIYHSAEYASSLRLPIIPADTE